MTLFDHLKVWLVTFLMGAAALVIFVAELYRYAAVMAIPGLQDWLLSIHMTWAQELTNILFVWMAKFGAAMVCAPASTSAGVAHLDGRQRRPAGHQPDVLPLFAGHGELPQS